MGICSQLLSWGNKEIMAQDQKLFRNNKNGNLYRMVDVATDCTNSRADTPVVIYSPVDTPEKLYVREEKEFAEKFTRVS